MIATDRKARIAAVVAGLGALAAGTTDDGLAVGELIAAASAAAIAYGAVFGISNGPTPGSSSCTCAATAGQPDLYPLTIAGVVHRLDGPCHDVDDTVELERPEP